MALSHKDRFRLKSNLVDTLVSNAWPVAKIDLLFSEFGIVQNEDWQIQDTVGSLSDSLLVEVFALVFDLPEAEVTEAVESDDDGNWKPGYIRLFLSHSAKHKAFVSDVADELAVVGIHGFVAHETMQVSKPWQAQIEQSLRSMQAFVAFIHPEFNDSGWCHQETGWALGRRVPHFAVRMEADPAGFLGHDQWPSAAGQGAKRVANVIQKWVAGLPELGPSVVDGLFKALEDANDYISAGAAAQRIAQLDSLSSDDFARLTRIYWANNQVRGGLPTRELRPLYERSGAASWPPPKASLAAGVPALG